VIEFTWDDILQFEVDSDQMTFNFEYRREGRKPRWVRIFTPYVSPPPFFVVRLHFVLSVLTGISEIEENKIITAMWPFEMAILHFLLIELIV